MRITIPDALAEFYQRLHPGKDLDEILTKQLTRYQGVPLYERIIPLRGPQIHQIESLLDGRSIESAKDLIEALEKRVALTIGGVDIPFSQSQLSEIERRARKERISTAEMLQRVAKEAMKLMLDEVGV